MNNYIQRVGLTAWRKKSSILLGTVLLLLLIYGLQYSQTDKSSGKYDKTGSDEEVGRDNVKFLAMQQKLKEPNENSVNRLDYDKLSKMEQPSRDDIAARNGMNDQKNNALRELEQQLSIPYVKLDPVNPYIPKHRIVHFDLKGAPPTIGYLKKLMPIIRNMGATGILLEYEDMFPYNGLLESIKARNAYTEKEVRDLLQTASDNKLEVIPLIQTFGHVEFALKHREWSTIREVSDSPQALCPSRNSSLDFIAEMINQILAVHEHITYLHIGCDEVFQMGECDICRLELHEHLFLRHVRHVASLALTQRPTLKLLIWDDMLRHIAQETMIASRLGTEYHVEPMVWVYAEDIYRFVQPPIWEKYAAVFDGVWAASAFKGAFGETVYVPDARRHLENNLRWLDVMHEQTVAFKEGFRGLVLTGWQRYDHFAILCELLPAALPSLALSLTAVTHGYFNSSLRNAFLSGLSCPQSSGRSQTAFINLETDPHMLDKLGRCMFPGSPFFRLLYRLRSAELETTDYLRTTTYTRAWLTSYNVRHNYSLPLRVDELTADVSRLYHALVAIARSTVDALHDVVDGYTVTEWIEQRLYPHIHQLERIQNESVVLKGVSEWGARPVPPLRELERLGIPLPP